MKMLKILLLSLSRQHTVDGQYIPSLFIEPEVRHDKTSYIVRIVLYIGCSGPVIGSSTAYILNIFKPMTTGTMPSTTQILYTATKWRATPQIIHRNMQNFLFLHLFEIFIMWCHLIITNDLNSALISLWTHFGHIKSHWLARIRLVLS